jgi:hypothetical protein
MNRSRSGASTGVRPRRGYDDSNRFPRETILTAYPSSTTGTDPARLMQILTAELSSLTEMRSHVRRDPEVEA